MRRFFRLKRSQRQQLAASTWHLAAEWRAENETRQQITLRLDPDVLKFFRKQGRGYQTTINAVLRKYMEARERRT